jgi:hypothetical protein
MNKITLLLNLVLLISLSSKAQDKANYDTLRKLCNGPIFTLCEEMPYLTKGSDAYADTIKHYLATKNQILNPGKFWLNLSVLATGEIKYIEVLSSDINNSKELIDAVADISNQWTPGKQNKRLVCCYRRLNIEVTDNNIKVTVPKGLK